jgi:hypothetical protein
LGGGFGTEKWKHSRLIHHHQNHKAEDSAHHQADCQQHDAVDSAGKQTAGNLPDDAD